MATLKPSSAAIPRNSVRLAHWIVKISAGLVVACSVAAIVLRPAPDGSFSGASPAFWIILFFGFSLIPVLILAIRSAWQAERLSDNFEKTRTALHSEAERRKKAEDALREAEKQFDAKIADRTAALSSGLEQAHAAQLRLEAALRGGGIGTWFWAVETNEIWWDESVTRLLGLDPSSKIEYSCEVLNARVHPSDRAALADATQLALTSQKPFHVEFRLCQPNGVYRWAASCANFERSADGGIHRLNGTCVDINDQRLIADALRRSEENFRFLADALPTLVWAAGHDGMLDYVNQRCIDYTGLTVEHLRLYGWSSALHPEDAKASVACWCASLATGSDFEFEYRLKRASDGAYRWYLARAFPQRNSLGEVVRWVGTCTDIHDRKEMTGVLDAQVAARTQELREKEQFLQSIFRGVEMAISIWNVQPDGNYRLAAVNASYEEQVGFSAQQLVGHDARELTEFFSDATVGAIVHRLDECIAARTTVDYEVETELKGQMRWWYRRINPIVDGDGPITRIITSSIDVTERKRDEIELALARDQALEGSRLKSEFLATMSHEIRTPMNGIIGMASILLETTLESRQREMGEVIRRSAESLLQIINDILDFSKIEAGKMRLDPEVFNPRDLLEGTTALLASHAHRKQLELICDLDSALNCGLEGDSGRIQQVVTNLLGNALKFTEWGEVILMARCVDKTADAMTIRVTVRDTGIGISESVQERLFQPFSQGDSSSTRRFGGTGLGLAICRQLIELMGGRLGCESTEGLGSSFWFELALPRRELGRLDTPQPFQIENPVLVVDDNDTARRVLVGQMNALGASPTALDDALEVLPAMLRAAQDGRPYQLVILDHHMLRMDGLAVAQAIRKERSIALTPLILLSSSTLERSPDFQAARLDATLDKPVREAQLRRTVLRLLGKLGETPTIFDSHHPLPRPNSLHLLVVEDNIPNQLVATMMLQHQGHRVDLANNGLEALSKLATVVYDAVLMDCQMPELDGYETTRRVRSGEVPGVNARIPIVALTAHAMAADRAKCLAAGMDEYVSKPLDAHSLESAFARCGLIKTPANRSTPPLEVFKLEIPPEQPILDPAHVDQLQQLRGPSGASLFQEVAVMFARELPGRLTALEENVEANQAETVARMAHTLAGSCASLGAKRLRTFVADLETAAKQACWERASSSLGSVKLASRELCDELTRLKMLS